MNANTRLACRARPVSGTRGTSWLCVGSMVFVTGLVASFACRASDDQRFVGFECVPASGMLRISYHSDHLHPLFSEGYLVDSFQLKKNDPSGEYVESVRQVTKTCSIKGVHYVVRIRGVPGAGRLGKDQSHCREC